MKVNFDRKRAAAILTMKMSSILKALGCRKRRRKRIK